MLNIVLQNERVKLKRARNPRDDDKLEERQPQKPLLEREKQPEKKTSRTPGSTNDFVKVSTRKKEEDKEEKKTGGDNEGTPRISASRARNKKAMVDSVVIMPGAGMTYAQILKDMKQNVKPNKVKPEVLIHNVKKIQKAMCR